MLAKNIYFTLVSELNNGQPGIRPNTNKMARFNVAVPLFKAGKIYFPIELKKTGPMLEAINELELVAVSGFRSKHDDFIDTISMLPLMHAFKPSEEAPVSENDGGGMWEIEGGYAAPDRMSSYVV